MIEQCTVGGKPAGPVADQWVFRADGSRAILGPEGKTLAEGQYTTVPTAGALNMNSGNGPNDQYECLYKLDGDTLLLNVGWQKAARPTALESPPGSQCTLYVMKRVKPKE
jgi:hypothetical protein